MVWTVNTDRSLERIEWNGSDALTVCVCVVVFVFGLRVRTSQVHILLSSFTEFAAQLRH